MKVLAINGSPKKKGNTAQILKTVGDVLEQNGIQVEYLHIGSMPLKHCVACNVCAKKRDCTCALGNDGLDEIIQKMDETDGLLLGSPTYFSDVSSAMKAFLDRAFYVCGNNKNLLRHKVGAAVVAVRRAGGIPTMDTMHRFFTYSEMFIPGTNYWPAVYGLTPGQVEEDTEGQCALTVLGQNMAWLMKAVENMKAQNPPPEYMRKPYMSFIR